MEIKIFIILVFGFLVISCNDNANQIAENNSDLIEITKEQFESEKMQISEAELKPFVNKIHFTGKIIPSVDGVAHISLPLSGIIEKIHCKPSQMVNKGSVLFEISGHWFIDLQRDF